MATRAELRQCCEELGIDSNNLSSEEMTQKVRDTFDKSYQKRKYVNPSDFSDVLLNFLINEYDWVLETRNKKQISLEEYKRLKDAKETE